MDINKVFQISKMNRNTYRWEVVLHFFRTYDVSSEVKKLWFVLEALQTIASCGQDFIKDTKIKKLTDQQIAQLYSDMWSYIHNKKIVWSKLLLLAIHYYDLIKNKDLVSLKNVDLFYKGALKIDQIMREEAVEFTWASWKKYWFITIWSVHTAQLEVMEDIALNLFDDYSQGILAEYQKFKWIWQVRRLLSNLWVIKYYTDLWDLEKVEQTKLINTKLLTSIINKNENKKASVAV